jgi:SAM-dependent methyltransferase
MPISDDSLDFAYSLGVIHHIPDSESAVKSVVKSLKPGAPFLIYLYYNLDNQKRIIYFIWKTSDILRKVVSRLPFKIKSILAETIAIIIYWPLARFSKLLSYFGLNSDKIPLNFYANLSFYTMRTDSLDRFSTRLERRFSKEEIQQLLETSGLKNISFSTESPFWCAVGYKA